MWKGDAHVDVEEVERHYQRVFEGCGGSAALTDGECASHFYSYAAFQSEQGNTDLALNAYERAIARYRRLPPERSVHRVNCLQDYAEALTRSGRSTNTEPLLREALAELPPDFTDFRVCRTYYRLGEIEQDRGAGGVAEFQRCLAGIGTLVAEHRPSPENEAMAAALADEVTPAGVARLWSATTLHDQEARELIRESVRRLALSEAEFGVDAAGYARLALELERPAPPAAFDGRPL